MRLSQISHKYRKHCKPKCSRGGPAWFTKHAITKLAGQFYGPHGCPSSAAEEFRVPATRNVPALLIVRHFNCSLERVRSNAVRMETNRCARESISLLSKCSFRMRDKSFLSFGVRGSVNEEICRFFCIFSQMCLIVIRFY